MLLHEAIEQFDTWRGLKVKQNTVKGYNGSLRHFAVFMHDCHIEEVKLDHILKWFSLMQTLGYQNNTFISIGTALRKMFQFYKKQDYRVLDPSLIPIPHKEFNLPRITDANKLNKLLAVIPTKTNDPRHIRNLSIITLLWDTGARNSEILSLNVSDLDLANNKACIKTEKSRGIRPFRELVWRPETTQYLLIWLKKRDQLLQKWKLDTQAIFVSISHLPGQRLTNRGVGEMLRQYSNKAGLPSVNAHSFRHAKARRIVTQGGSAADVMNVMGHSSIASATPYTLTWGKDLEDTAKKYL